MNQPARPADRPSEPEVAARRAADCAGKPARPSHVIGMRRIMGLQTAATMVGGQDKLASALSIETRSLRAKLAANRGISDADLLFAAAAVEARAEYLIQHATKLRDEAADA